VAVCARWGGGGERGWEGFANQARSLKWERTITITGKKNSFGKTDDLISGEGLPAERA